MTLDTASMGHAAQLGTKNESTYGTAVTVDQRFVFVSESIAKQGVILEREGVRGTRSRVSDDTRVGPYRVAGQLVLEPSPEDLAIWLPRILGGTPSGTSYPLAETLPFFTLAIDRVTKVFTYAGCKVARAILSGAEGGMLRLVMDIVAKSEAVGNAGTFPSLTPSVTGPYIFEDLTLTLLTSVAKQAKSFELTIDNNLVTDRFYNNLTIINLPEGERTVSLRTQHAYSAGTGTTGNTDLYEQALAGAPGTLAFAYGGYSTSFAFGTLQVPPNSPTVPGKTEIMLALDMIARKTGSTLELAVTHDSTP